MTFLETRHKKKSAIITLLLLALILIAIFNLGMKYLDPPQEYGVAINFGDSNVGSNSIKETKSTTPKANQQEEKIEEVKEPTLKEVVKEEVITQDTEEAPVVDTSKEENNRDKKLEEKEKPKETPVPKPSKETQDALNSLLSGKPNDDEKRGEGDDNTQAVKGNAKGDSNSNKYYGNNGSGGDSNYNLAGRSALSKPIEKPKCNEEGIVVVSIEVDNTGKVIKAVPGVKGSTNTAKCLLDPAKLAALKTRWNPDVNAPNKQRGIIIYRFTLSK